MIINILGEILRRVGNLCYIMNGGLEKVNNHSTLDNLTFWCWSKSYSLVDKG